MIKILFVDYSLSYKKRLKQYIHLPDLEFAFVQDGTEAVGLILKQKINVVFSHLGNNGDLDDIELMLNIKELNPDIPVIIILSSDFQARSDSILKAGAFACIREEASGQELMEIIGRIFE